MRHACIVRLNGSVKLNSGHRLSAKVGCMPQDLVRRSPNPTCDGDTPTTATGGRLWLPAPLVICSILRACQVFIEATVAAGRRGLVVWLAAVLRFYAFCAPPPPLSVETQPAMHLPCHSMPPWSSSSSLGSYMRYVTLYPRPRV